jgi:2-C-methyl-D-erythritol 4-phosphate cytidylyltransferase
MNAAAKATAIIAAAGSGGRLGASEPKALVDLAGRPLVAWSIDALDAAESVTAIVAAAPAGREAELEALAPAGTAMRVVAGGETRSESVQAALAVTDAELVAIHDAARPMLTAALVDALLAQLVGHPDADGVIAAAPILDTVKRARAPRTEGGGFEHGDPAIAETEARDHLWAAQTPQAFRTSALRDAYGAGGQRLRAATDEAMLVEAAGGTVLIHPAPASNMKVTTAEDLRVAELLLGDRD